MKIDFGYPWWLSYGHVPLIAVSGALLLLGRARKWRWWLLAPVGAFCLWAVLAWCVVLFGFGANSVPDLPTEAFLRSGEGRVLDMGAGTGRSSIMVLQARPRTTLVALDLFARSFEQHFGPGADPRERLRANLREAGVEPRAAIETGDVRKLPFEDRSFDAVVSAYAIDHLPRAESAASIAEAARVCKPGGEFLLMVNGKEPWGRFAFGPLLSHGGWRGADLWLDWMKRAGFEVVESGTKPVTLYILGRKP